MESKITHEQHAMIKRVLVAQTESLGRVESPIVEELLRNHRSRSALDIGCGEGSFLIQLAHNLRTTRFLGIDQNELAVRDAERRRRRLSIRNVQFQSAFFDEKFEQTNYDTIMTRYTLQHASDPPAFLKSVIERLNARGQFIAVESLDAYTDCHINEPVWNRFRTSLDAVHERVGSNNNMGKSLGVMLKRAGFLEIQIRIVLCSPSTVGYKRFKLVVQATADLAHAFFPNLFDKQLHQDLSAWLGDRSLIEKQDPYLTTAVANASKR